MYRLIAYIRKKEEIPERWSVAVICPIHKKR